MFEYDDSTFLSPLTACVVYNNTDLLRALLEHVGASPDLPNKDFAYLGHEPLVKAATENNSDIVEVI